MIDLTEFLTRAQIGFALMVIAFVAVLWFFAKTKISGRSSRSRK